MGVGADAVSACGSSINLPGCGTDIATPRTVLVTGGDLPAGPPSDYRHAFLSTAFGSVLGLAATRMRWNSVRGRAGAATGCMVSSGVMLLVCVTMIALIAGGAFNEKDEQVQHPQPCKIVPGARISLARDAALADGSTVQAPAAGWAISAPAGGSDASAVRVVVAGKVFMMPASGLRCLAQHTDDQDAGDQNDAKEGLDAKRAAAAQHHNDHNDSSDSADLSPNGTQGQNDSSDALNHNDVGDHDDAHGGAGIWAINGTKDHKDNQDGSDLTDSTDTHGSQGHKDGSDASKGSDDNDDYDQADYRDWAYPTLSSSSMGLIAVILAAYYMRRTWLASLEQVVQGSRVSVEMEAAPRDGVPADGRLPYPSP
eukprot:TRINITY_DN1825_c0_g1_i7.p1 TRINITY_DN1825_c0_g1~~TRINITY_DN1825_c0_g1_i7.p1  ORF type:complete len:398 (+),score=117.48 TRINITY_DN1825_c0_g1_i7:90-1196(+)